MIHLIKCETTQAVRVMHSKGTGKQAVKAVQHFSPTKVCLIGTVPGNQKDCGALHLEMTKQGKHVRGEWFRLTDNEALALVLSSNRKKYHPPVVISHKTKTVEAVLGDFLSVKAKKWLDKRDADDAAETF